MQMLQEQVCQVCGDPLAAFYCGAVVCEACKKFFIRSWKQSNENNYVCLQDNKCSITKESRKHCASCRYDRCLDLKMYLPGGPSLLQEISKIPCKVCRAPSSGFHFGALTCEGCKGFFRRWCQEKKLDKFKCNENNVCDIIAGKRSLCRACRLKKCLSVGMQAEKCRIGRQPNIIKHTTKLELLKINKCSSNNLDETACKREKNELEFPCVMEYPITNSEKDVSTSCNINDKEEELVKDVCDYGAIAWSSIDQPEKLISHQNFSKKIHSEKRVIETKCPKNRTDDNLTEDCKVLDKKRFFGKQINKLRQRVTCFSRASSLSNNFKKSTLNKIPDDNSKPFSESLVVLSHSGDSNTSEINSAHAQECKDQPNTVFEKHKNVLYCSKFSKPSIHSCSKTCPPSTKITGKISELPNYFEVVKVIENSFSYLSPILSRNSAPPLTEHSSIEEMWKVQMLQFERCAYAALAFARHVPGFRKLPLAAQIELIQKSLYPVVVCVLSLLYDLQTSSFSFFSFTPLETREILKKFPMFRPLTKTFMDLGEKIKSLNLNNTEIALLCAVFLLDTGDKYDYKEILIDSVEWYVKEKYGPNTDRHHHILMILRTMSETNQMHNEAIADLLKNPRFSSLPIPQLFEEMFLNNDVISTS